MARTTIAAIHESGWSFRVVAERSDVRLLGEEWLEVERQDAPRRMRGAQRHLLRAVKATLSRIDDEAARPNEPPRMISGQLRRSWRMGRRSWNRDKTTLTGRVESRHPAAGPLEFGALISLGIRPHPYYRPTLARESDTLGDILEGVRELGG